MLTQIIGLRRCLAALPLSISSEIGPLISQHRQDKWADNFLQRHNVAASLSLSRCKHGPGHSTRRSADDSIKSSGYFSSVFVGLIRLSLMRIKRLQLTEGVGARFKLDFLKPEPRRNTRSPSSCSSLLFSTTMLSI